jgi:hypothetical protein
MTDRVNFIQSIDGIEYPEMIVKFFDHFLALKEIVDNSGSVSISHEQISNPDCISFNIHFTGQKDINQAINEISQRSVIYIYNRPISVSMEVLSEKEIKIIMK